MQHCGPGRHGIMMTGWDCDSVWGTCEGKRDLVPEEDEPSPLSRSTWPPRRNLIRRLVTRCRFRLFKTCPTVMHMFPQLCIQLRGESEHLCIHLQGDSPCGTRLCSQMTSSISQLACARSSDLLLSFLVVMEKTYIQHISMAMVQTPQ